MDPFGFAEVAVLPEVEPVVGGEEDERVLFQSQHIELRQQSAYPEVDHGHLAAVRRVSAGYVVHTETDCFPLPVGWVELVSIVPGQIQGSVVLRRVPRFVRVPRSEERRVGKECRSRWSPYH